MEGDTLRVVVVEDDFLVSEMIKELLEGLGYTIVGEAASGLQAIEVTCRLRPDVVLMDIEMPDMDGLEATENIFACCPTAVVVLTAYETQELVSRAGAAGVGAYLVKPPNARELERAITIARARFQDLLEMHRLNTELQVRNEELNAFAHTVAHDLKNSVQLIVGHAKLMAAQSVATTEALSDDDIPRSLAAILRTSGKMNNIIEELMLLFGLREQSVSSSPLDMNVIVSEAVARLSAMIQSTSAEISYPEQWPLALGYAPWVEEVWVNYLSNALKYGGRPPRVELGAEVTTICPDGAVADSAMACFWVRDNGPGIAPADRDKLFTPVVNLNHIRVQGHGLGLSIVRRIVTKLGGRVGVQTELGQGSVFSFSLPLATGGGRDTRPT